MMEHASGGPPKSNWRQLEQSVVAGDGLPHCAALPCLA